MAATNSITFERPPIVEVAFGVSFLEDPAFSAAQVGKYWTEIQAEFPQTSDRPPVDPHHEQFDDQPSEVQFQLSSMPPLRRTWFEREDRAQLIQVQANRFNFNVRSRTGPYERFATTHPMFQSAWSKFAGFLGQLAGSEPAPTQYELAYVNHIPVEGPFTSMKDIGKVFRDVTWSESGKTLLGAPQQVSWRASFEMPEKQGRLHVDLSTGRMKGNPGLRLTMLARGYRKDSMSAWFEVAHEWIVKGFKELTTPEMHQHWGLRE
jgi:uncharacterized protein (TIGR04255 family)